jgi:hypothetical protein
MFTCFYVNQCNKIQCLLTDFQNKSPLPTPERNARDFTAANRKREVPVPFSERIHTVIYVYVGFSPVGDGGNSISIAVLCLPRVSQDISRTYRSVWRGPTSLLPVSGSALGTILLQEANNMLPSSRLGEPERSQFESL